MAIGSRASGPMCSKAEPQLQLVLLSRVRIVSVSSVTHPGDILCKGCHYDCLCVSWLAF